MLVTEAIILLLISMLARDNIAQGEFLILGHPNLKPSTDKQAVKHC